MEDKSLLWDLDKLYHGLDDPAYKEDVERYTALSSDYAKLVESIEGEPGVAEVEQLLLVHEEMDEIISKAYNYVGLSQATDAENGTLLAESNRLMRLVSDNVGTETKATKLLAGIKELNAYAAQSKLIAEYRFYLEQKQKEVSHMLSDAEEELYARMDMTGGSAWENLQGYLTSTVKVDYEGEQITLSQVRNLASDSSPAVRKKAYEAELACYEKIADSIAYALNNIKLQMNMIAEKRGYESPLAMTLQNSTMSRKTLDAMMAAIQEHLPKLRRYLTHKAKKLGYSGGLPWYELFAPLGKDDKKYTIEETKQVLLETFSGFSPEMSGLMKEAFENRWIDFMPKKGKAGGAFDCGCACIGESRVLTNFDGTFASIDTLAHELGHSFHDRQVQGNRTLNREYSMPVAETASTFNETLLCSTYVEKAKNDEEKLSLLEGLLKEQIQCIVDIYSRYLFETAVFEQCEEKFLMPKDLNELMLDAQKQAYGEGLDQNVMHPYMWACKGHYYSTGLSFYNFPYAFGVLFAAGLYELYTREGSESFVPKYKAMLAATPTCTVEDAGALMGIDLTEKGFWENSLRMIEKNIDVFCSL